jgi:type III pantothenate kinase
VFQSDSLLEKGILAHMDIPNWEIPHSTFEKIIVSNVNQASIVEQLKTKFAQPIELFSTRFTLPFESHLSPYQSLGLDRWAGVLGAYAIHKKPGFIVIDAGTCITCDVVDANQGYVGGLISPGLSLRYKALKQFTARLPLLEKDEAFNLIIGDSTEAAIKVGVQQGFLAEVQSHIQQYTQLYQIHRIFFTGGDAGFITKHVDLHSAIQTLESDLVLKGLNYALLQI